MHTQVAWLCGAAHLDCFDDWIQLNHNTQMHTWSYQQKRSHLIGSECCVLIMLDTDQYMRREWQAWRACIMLCICTGCARLNVTTHKWHMQVCRAKLNDICAYTTAGLSDIRMSTRYLVICRWYENTWHLICGPKYLEQSAWHQVLLYQVLGTKYLVTRPYTISNDIRIAMPTDWKTCACLF